MSEGPLRVFQRALAEYVRLVRAMGSVDSFPGFVRHGGQVERVSREGSLSLCILVCEDDKKMVFL